MDRFYQAKGIVLLMLFAYAQYHGWSVFGSDEDKSAPRTLAPAFITNNFKRTAIMEFLHLDWLLNAWCFRCWASSCSGSVSSSSTN